jgi:hypothetical protein
MVLLEKARAGYRSARLLYRKSTHLLRLLPDFIIIGAQRGGTTSLYYYLTSYPGISQALMKEVHYFDDHFREGTPWYRAQFPTKLQRSYVESARGQRFLTGESSPYYLFYPPAPKRIKALVPNVKLIVLLRNPVERAYSHHWLATLEGNETLPFAEAVEREAERTAGEQERILRDEGYASFAHRHYTYLARGIYVDQLKHWMNFFPREQFLILKSEDFYKNTADTFRRTLDFLEVPTAAIRDQQDFKQYREPNRRGYQNEEKPPKLDASVRARLIDYFRPHNARLYEFLGQDFGWESP